MNHFFSAHFCLFVFALQKCECRFIALNRPDNVWAHSHMCGLKSSHILGRRGAEKDTRVFWGVSALWGRLPSGWAQAFVPHLHFALFDWQAYMDATSAANMLWDHGNNRSSLGSYAASFLTIRHERNNFRCQKRNCDKRKHFGFHGTGVCPQATALIKKTCLFLYIHN